MISRRGYADALGIDLKTASTDLRALSDAGYIVARGATRDRCYALLFLDN